MNIWEVKPSLDGTLQLHFNETAVLNLHRTIADNGEEHALTRDQYMNLCKLIASSLMACELLGRGGSL